MIALSLQQHIPHKDVYLITFGSPRVGNADYSVHCSTRLANRYRVTHKYDAGSRLLGAGAYSHLANELYYPGDGGGRGRD